MLDNLKHLDGAELRAAIEKRINVYTAIENGLDSFIDTVGQLVQASSEEMFDDLESTLAALSSRIVINVDGDNIPAPGKHFEKTGNTVGNQVVTLSKFSVPKKDTLIKNNALLKKTRQYKDELDYLVLRLSESKDPDDKTLMKTLIAHRVLMREKENKAQDLLEDTAKKHVPRELARCAEALSDHILQLTGKEVGHQWFVTQEDEDLNFTYFLDVTIQDNSKHEIRVVLALTGNVKEISDNYNMRVHLTSMNSFKLPGHFDLGNRINFTSAQTMTNAVKREANMLMAKQGLVAALSTNKLDKTTQQLKQAGIESLKHVIAIRVQGNAIYLMFSGDVSPAIIERQTVPDLIVLLKNVLHKDKKNAIFMRSLEKTKTGKLMMKIISVNEV